MAKDFSTMEDSNRSSNSNIHEVSLPSRRIVLRGGLGAALGGLLAPLAVVTLPGCASVGGGSLLGFKGIPVSVADKITVPEGYMAEVIAAYPNAGKGTAATPAGHGPSHEHKVAEAQTKNIADAQSKAQVVPAGNGGGYLNEVSSLTVPNNPGDHREH